MNKSFGGVLMVLPLLAAAACTGAVDTPNTKPGGTGGPTSGGTGGGSAGSGALPGSGGGTTATGGGPVIPGSGGGGVAPGTGGIGAGGANVGIGGAAPAESAGLMPFLRLTHREYSNTMAELLGDLSNIGATFEADNDGQAGFVSPSNVATENAKQYMVASEKLAATAISSGKLTIPCTNPANAAAETTCITQFVSQFGARAYRRPLVQAESDDLITLFRGARTLGFTFVESVTRVVEAMLQSPNLLYHWEIGDQPLVRDPGNSALVALTPYQLASRLSYFLGESPPDAALTTAAASGALSTPEGMRTQATRLLQDERRAKKAMFNFHKQWLHMQHLEESAPGELGTLLGQELEAFLSSVLITGDGTLKTMLTAPYTYANATTAREYNLTATGTAFSKLELNPAQRQGVLMQVPFLRANGIAPPVFRGLTVYRQMLCGTVPAPPAMAGQVTPDQTSTTRELFAQHGQAACAKGCHQLFDPWGFAFENFDAVGRYRTTENGKPVDPSGVAQPNGVVGGTTPKGQTMAFKNAGELVNVLAASDEVNACVTKQWARYMLGRMETDADLGGIAAAYQSAAYQADRTTARPFSVRDFLVNVVGTKTFRFRQRAPGETL